MMQYMIISPYGVISEYLFVELEIDLNLAGIIRNKHEYAGFGRIWQDLAGFGRSRQELAGGIGSGMRCRIMWMLISYIV